MIYEVWTDGDTIAYSGTDIYEARRHAAMADESGWVFTFKNENDIDPEQYTIDEFEDAFF